VSAFELCRPDKLCLTQEQRDERRLARNARSVARIKKLRDEQEARLATYSPQKLAQLKARRAAQAKVMRPDSARLNTVLTDKFDSMKKKKMRICKTCCDLAHARTAPLCAECGRPPGVAK